MTNHFKDMEVSIRILKEKKLVGKRMTMSFSDNKTGELWKGFKSRRKEIKNHIGSSLFSM
jgi:AraC family transcriptional regulator